MPRFLYLIWVLNLIFLVLCVFYLGFTDPLVFSNKVGFVLCLFPTLVFSFSLIFYEIRKKKKEIPRSIRIERDTLQSLEKIAYRKALKTAFYVTLVIESLLVFQIFRR